MASDFFDIWGPFWGVLVQIWSNFQKSLLWHIETPHFLGYFRVPYSSISVKVAHKITHNLQASGGDCGASRLCALLLTFISSQGERQSSRSEGVRFGGADAEREYSERQPEGR